MRNWTVGGGKFVTPNAKYSAVRIETICVHSDTPNSVEIASAVASSLRQINPERIR